jgi:hypothetical protein
LTIGYGFGFGISFGSLRIHNTADNNEDTTGTDVSRSLNYQHPLTQTVGSHSPGTGTAPSGPAPLCTTPPGATGTPPGSSPPGATGTPPGSGLPGATVTAPGSGPPAQCQTHLSSIPASV